MERRWLIVSNSSSGSADESKQKAIVQTLQTSGPVKVVAPSSLQTFDAEVRRAARGADVIIAAGGDGTMNSTLNAIGDNLGASSIPESLALAAGVKAATHEDLDHVETIASARIEIHADPEIQFNVDGELIGLKSPATFEIVSSVRFLVPA